MRFRSSILVATALAQDNCFRQSPTQNSFGLNQGTYQSDLDLLTSSLADKITKFHMISKIQYCVELTPTGAEKNLLALQTTVSAYSENVWVDPVILNTFGSASISPRRCSSWDLPPGQQIDEVVIYYDSSDFVTPVYFISIVAGLDFLIVGDSTRQSQVQMSKFKPTSTHQIYGFWGYESTTIQNLGVVQYKTSCDPNPGKLPSNYVEEEVVVVVVDPVIPVDPIVQPEPALETQSESTDYLPIILGVLISGVVLITAIIVILVILSCGCPAVCIGFFEATVLTCKMVVSILLSCCFCCGFKKGKFLKSPPKLTRVMAAIESPSDLDKLNQASQLQINNSCRSDQPLIPVVPTRIHVDDLEKNNQSIFVESETQTISDKVGFALNQSIQDDLEEPQRTINATIEVTQEVEIKIETLTPREIQIKPEIVAQPEIETNKEIGLQKEIVAQTEIQLDKEITIEIEEDQQIETLNETPKQVDDVLEQSLPDEQSHIIHQGHEEVRISQDSLCMETVDLEVVKEEPEFIKESVNIQAVKGSANDIIVQEAELIEVLKNVQEIQEEAKEAYVREEAELIAESDYIQAYKGAENTLTERFNVSSHIDDHTAASNKLFKHNGELLSTGGGLANNIEGSIEEQPSVPDIDVESASSEPCLVPLNHRKNKIDTIQTSIQEFSKVASKKKRGSSSHFNSHSAKKQGFLMSNDKRQQSPFFDKLPELEEETEADNLLALIQNLREKKALRCLSALDKKLLKKITQTVRENPQHYSGKIGYLQILYEK